MSNVDDSKGHKRSLSTVLGSLAEMGYDIDDI